MCTSVRAERKRETGVAHNAMVTLCMKTVYNDGMCGSHCTLKCVSEILYMYW